MDRERRLRQVELDNTIDSIRRFKMLVSSRASGKYPEWDTFQNSKLMRVWKYPESDSYDDYLKEKNK